MKKITALLLASNILLTMTSCNLVENLKIPHPSKTDLNITEENVIPGNTQSQIPGISDEIDPSIDEVNRFAIQAYKLAIQNEINVYYPLLLSSTPHETYFRNVCGKDKGTPTRQALVDMDKDGIKELILDYNSYFIILLHFENGVVYATDFRLESMETIYEDGSFSWSNDDDVFGYECGISRVSFVNGVKKVEELCRIEGDSKFFIGGLPVEKEQYDDYVDNINRTPIKFIPFDPSYLDSNESRAIELASAHWGIKDGDFDSERGLRYRIICSGKEGDQYCVSLYRFVYNEYYEHMEIAYVNIDTGKIIIYKYPDGK